MKTAFSGGESDVSATLTNAVSPTCVVLAESLNSLIPIFSVPSVVRSLARVWAKLIVPSDLTTRLPLREPLEKSFASMPVPLKDQ